MTIDADFLLVGGLLTLSLYFARSFLQRPSHRTNAYSSVLCLAVAIRLSTGCCSTIAEVVGIAPGGPTMNRVALAASSAALIMALAFLVEIAWNVVRGRGRSRNGGGNADSRDEDTFRSDRARILIVDDDVMVRTLTVHSLSQEGYILDEAADGSEGLAKALRQTPDVVITDLMMPIMNGVEMIRAMRSHARLKTVPIVLLTAKEGEDTRREVREAGADDYLAKPFNVWEIRALVRNTIALKSKEKSMIKEMEEARRIQRSLLPQNIPRVAGLQVTAAYQPAALVGGDYYDVIPLADGSLAVLVADVSGHGLPAAMIASAMKIVVSMSTETISEPAGLLVLLNRVLHGKTAGKFATMSCGVIRPDRREVVFALAGHPEPILLRAKKAASIVAPHRLPIGIRAQVAYASAHAELAAGDRIFFYSDAFTEAFDSAHTIFGEDRLLAAISQTADLALDDQIEAVIARVREFQGGELHDDATIVAVAIF